MTLNELQIQLDISSGNELDVLNKHACEIKYGYFFVDSSDGQCYLFNEHGHLDDINKVKIIGNYAFYNCTSLESIIIPGSVESIGNDAFWNCRSLESIMIPGSVESIKNRVFAYCKSLKSVIIPSSVKSIGYLAFNGCISLKEVIFKGKTIDQVKAMYYYPWGIRDTNIIKCQMS